jgi:hypothetical protein
MSLDMYRISRDDEGDQENTCNKRATYAVFSTLVRPDAMRVPAPTYKTNTSTTDEPGHTTSSDSSIAIDHAARQLADIISNSPNPVDAIANTQAELRHFCCDYPAELDRGVRAFCTALDRLPANFPAAHGTSGPEAAKRIFFMYLSEELGFLQGGTNPDVGSTRVWDFDAEDASTVEFTAEEVAGRRRDVINKVRNFAEARRDSLVMQTIVGRCLALQLQWIETGGYAGKKQHELIDWAVDPHHDGSPPWCKADFVAASIMLRSCAKTLFEKMPDDAKREEKMKLWKDGYAAFLITGPQAENVKHKGDDFYVKYHAAVGFSPFRLLRSWMSLLT